MIEKKVSELMIPLSDYACVSEEETLAGAIKVLKEANAKATLTHKHRAVLVCTPDNHVIGKVGIREMLKALEPKYRQFENPDHVGTVDLSRFGFDHTFLHSLVDQFSLWDESVDELVSKAGKRKVKDIMYTPSKGEYVNVNAPLAEAVHQFILGCHQSLLVLEKDRVIGILRLADIFDLVCDLM